MKIGRFIKTTLSDWKGHNSCRIDFRGSDLSCPFFLQSDLLEEEDPFIEEQEILDYIADRGTLLDGIILGGEPLRYNDLYGFLKKLRSKELGKKQILLETCGTRPDELDDIVGAMMVDEVRFFLPFPINSEPPNDIIEYHVDKNNVRRSIEVMKGSDAPCTFVTVAVPGIMDEADITRIAKSIGSDAKLEIWKFEPEKCRDQTLVKNKAFTRAQILALHASAKKYVKKTELKGF